MVVEGAGGLLVPVAGNRTMIDLMAMLGLPVILAARPGLGTINHTLLSIRELERSGLELLGIIFCETSRTGWGEIEEDNVETIGRIGKARVLGRIPYMAELAENRNEPSDFYKLCNSASEAHANRKIKAL